MKIWFNVIKYVVIVILVYVGASLMFPSINIFKIRPFELKKTAVIIEGSKKLAQLHGAKYYSELVLDTFKVFNHDNLLYSDESKYRLTIIGNGTVYAGVNLINLNEKDITIADTVCTINLPPSEILSAVINPSDFYIFIDEGEWEPQEVQDIKTLLVDRVTKQAIADKILEKSDTKVEEMLTVFIKSLGYKKVEFTRTK